MDIFPTLKKQHRELEELFRTVSSAHGIDRKARVFEELSDTLVAHVGLEERLLRAALARSPRSSGLLEAWEARLRVERLITMLAPMDVSSPMIEGELARLQDLVQERVSREESHLFPVVARYLTAPSGLSAGTDPEPKSLGADA